MPFVSRYYKSAAHLFFMDSFETLVNSISVTDEGVINTFDADTQVAWPGENFDSEDPLLVDKVWFKPVVVLPVPRQAALGTSSRRHCTGAFNILIYCPLGMSESRCFNFAQPFLDRYKPRTKYKAGEDSITCTETGILLSQKDDTINRWVVAIRVTFDAYML